ncbi:MAG: hypothetical protein DI629_06910 [Mesorhizobium amorphae]|nr:MAG: hypothetical protein DI629_06910 [Mesorhizobium amorphae]
MEELVAAAAPAPPRPASAAPAVDFLAAVEEAPADRPLVSPSEAAASYRDVALEDEFAAILEARQAEVLGEMPSLSPDAIAAELGLDGAGAHDLARARRVFAMRNHPDRVAPHLRDHALRRMQIANALIDQAALGRSRAAS